MACKTDFRDLTASLRWQQHDLARLGDPREWHTMRDGPHYGKGITRRAELAKARGDLRAYEKLSALAMEVGSIRPGD